MSEHASTLKSFGCATALVGLEGGLAGASVATAIDIYTRYKFDMLIPPEMLPTLATTRTGFAAGAGFALYGYLATRFIDYVGEKTIGHEPFVSAEDRMDGAIRMAYPAGVVAYLSIISPNF